MRKHRAKKTGGHAGKAGKVLLCVVGFSGAAKAQQVLAPLPAYSVTPPAVQEMQDQGMGTILPAGGTPSLPSPATFLNVGPVVAHPHLFYQIEYGDGLQSSPGQQQASIVQRFSPGVLLGIGSHWTLDYTPTLTFYSDKALRDTVDHTASLNWGTYYGDWSAGFSQSYALNSDPLIETGTQTTTENFSTSISASHALNSVMSVDLGVSQTIFSADQFTSTSSWSTMDWLNYQFWPKLDAGIGLGAGYDQVSVGPNMSHEQLQARITWRVGDKLSVVVHGGAEDRQYINGGVPDSIDPTYGAAIQYAPFSQTSFSLSLDRSTSVSLFQDQVTDGTTLGVTLNQRLVGKVSMTATAGYSLIDYKSSAATIVNNGAPITASQPGRQDTSYSLGLRFSYAITDRLGASLFYSYSNNESTQGGFGFASSQEGFELNYHF